MIYRARGTKIEAVYDDGEVNLVAICLEARCAAEILEKAGIQQEHGHYTASARLFHQAEQLRGFQWVTP